MTPETLKTKTERARTPLEELNDLSSLAYLIYRRNKNQHRRSHWWRHFNNFRRKLHRLCSELVNVKQSAGAETVELDAKTEAHIDAWAQFYVTKWHSSFSQILAERRFAALGLTILALLAKVCGLTRVTTKLAQEQNGKELSEFLIREERVGQAWGLENDDVGIAVSRTIREQSDELGATPTVKSSTTKEKKNKKSKKSSKGDAIDNIFGVLD
jgi:ribonuclease MRP protein subunit RMP1